LDLFRPDSFRVLVSVGGEAFDETTRELGALVVRQVKRQGKQLIGVHSVRIAWLGATETMKLSHSVESLVRPA
jgi:hypothetical protein